MTAGQTVFTTFQTENNLIKGLKMDNIQILKQLLNGYHLEENELLKAEKIVSILKHEINSRLCKKHNKKKFSNELYKSIYKMEITK